MTAGSGELSVHELRYVFDPDGLPQSLDDFAVKRDRVTFDHNV
jgi:hypothetical protein